LGPLRGVQGAFGTFKVQSRFAAFKTPSACSKSLCGVQGAFGTFKVQSRFAAFKGR
jgi:hypothetical protein